MAVSMGVALAGIGRAGSSCVDPGAARRGWPSAFAGALPPAGEQVLRRRDLRRGRVVQPIVRGSTQLWKGVDAAVIDGAVNGVGETVGRPPTLLRRLQTGSVRAYAMVLVLGVVVVFGYLALR